MKDIDYLFGFGDSWPYGSELKPDQKTFVELLAKNLSIPHWNNFSLPSTSIPHLILQLQEAIKYASSNSIPLDRVLGIFFLTSPHRDLIWSNDGSPVEVHLNPNSKEDIFWYAKIHTRELCQYRTNTTLIALQSICQKYGIQDYYFWGWESLELWPEVDHEKIYNKLIIEHFVDNASKKLFLNVNWIDHLYHNKNPHIWPNLVHPNQQGHKKIARVLANWIKI